MSETMNSIQQTKKKRYYCKYCNKYILGSSYKFKAHLYLHNAVEAKYECCYCLKGYYRLDMYVRHLSSHTDSIKTHEKLRNKYTCDYCDRSYIHKRNLIIHLRNHEGNVSFKRFTCMACEVDFCENRILINHIRRVHFNHTDTKEPMHLKRMVNESWFENVEQTDTCVQITKVNNNVISIKKCGKIKKENKKDIKPFNNNNYSLRTDNFTSYSKAICDYCNKEMLKKSIRNHIRERHLNVRKFVCDVCKNSFNRHYQLVDHVCGKVVRKQRYKITSKSQRLRRGK